MRLRKVKNALERIKENPKCIVDPKSLKGKWKDLFKNDNPIYLEVGMGKGSFLIENAKRNPNINYIGMEKFDSVLVRACEKKEFNELDNIYFILGDANDLLEIFEENELDKIYLNFSDPWPKARHEKRRLTSHVFLSKYKVILKEDHTLEFKTDNRVFFEYSVKSFNEFKVLFVDLRLDLHKDEDVDNIQTEYEEKFSKLGPIYKIEIKFYN
jgi:tRNA (guanine-N7-)-methyltransferase